MRRTIAGLAPAAALPLPLSLSISPSIFSIFLSICLSICLSISLSLPSRALAEDQPSLEAPDLGRPEVAPEPARLAQRTLDPPATVDPPVTLQAEERTTGVFRIIPRKKSLGLFLAAQAVLLIDMGQTLDIRNNPRVVEANPLFGPEPSRERIYAIFGARLAANTLAHWLLPDRWANGLSMLNLVVGIPVVANNASLGLSVSF